VTPREDYSEVAKVGSYARDTAKAIAGHIRRNGMQTVFVMHGSVCATAANSKVAEAIDESDPIIGTYGVNASSLDIAADIAAWRDASRESELGPVRQCTCCGGSWPEDREFFPFKRGRLLAECKACTYERKARERRAA
jgi:hypothetical protein